MLEGFFSVISNILFFTSKIQNTNSFPQPLSSEKESEYLDKFRTGDKEARDVLIKHNLRLVAYIAKKYTNYPDQDELVSVGTMGLIKAINTYEKGKGTALATYASRCIENEILMTMRSYKRMSGTVSIYDNIGTDKDGNEMTFLDLLKVDEDVVYKDTDRKMLRDTMLKLTSESLNPRERSVVLYRYGMLDGNPHTQQETAKLMKISRSYISRIEKKALHKLKVALKEKNIEL